MPFEKGHKLSTGRKKGTKNGAQSLTRYYPKKWNTTFKHNAYNIEEIEHRLNNDLPIDDLIDKLANKYSHKKKK